MADMSCTLATHGLFRLDHGSAPHGSVCQRGANEVPGPMSKARDFSVRPLLVIWEMTQSIVDPQNEQLTFLREALG